MISFDTGDLAASVKELTDRVRDSVGEETLRATGFAGAQIFRDQAKENSLAHKKTGLLYDSIIVKRLEEESDGGRRQVYLVTVRNGRYIGDGAYYWRWIEYGHKFVPRNKKVSERTGRKIGWKAHRAAAALEYGTASAPAYPFMRPAYESRKRDAVDAMTKTLAEQIARNSK
jgi:HK97 gp10 family phage protein